ncbi:BTB/POZ domain protein [Quillaja saponaria]|uniref:BTB/POZ domain protein n=1 Tax=Quillaja saponaria TaxID=32244 RepID=A0AAD7VN56_QUISA|nr:BTB/POZ domain protein [Quillaja saponaria]
MKSPKKNPENNRSINGHTYILHCRLQNALSLGTRDYYEEIGKWKWHSENIEVQKHVVHSIAAFLDSLSEDTLQHPLVKDSVADMFAALLWTLECKNVEILDIAAKVTVKLVRVLPGSVLQAHTLDLVCPLICLLTSYQEEVAISCATALNVVISKLSAKNEKAIWNIVKEAGTVVCTSSIIKGFSEGTVVSIKYFQEIASLLSTILWRWPPSRLSILSDTNLIVVLADIHSEADSSVKILVMKLYSSLALCGTGAKILIENGEVFLQMIAHCMGNLYSPAVRIEALKLMQCLMRNEESCLRVIDFCGEPLVEAIISGMKEMGLQYSKIGNDNFSLLEEICSLALITRWAAQEGLDGNHLLGVRGYIWDILGWLAIHSSEDFNQDTDESELHLSILITCACLAFVNAIRKWCHICQNDVVDNLRNESASRAVLRMIYSPCNNIASTSRFILSAILESNGEECLKSILKTLGSISSLESYGSNKVQLSINLVALTCYSSLLLYQRCITQSNGMKTLVALVKRCLGTDNPVERFSISHHLHKIFHKRTCCWGFEEDWEGCNSLLLYSLWSLAELLHHYGLRDNLGIIADEMAYAEANLVRELQEISSNSYAPGLRWYAAYILSYFGFYGFPNKIGKRVGKSFNKKKHADAQFIHPNGHVLSVHCVVISVRCPSLLPPARKSNAKVIDNFSSNDPEKFGREIEREVRLTAHDDYEALMKFLEYVYVGFLQAGEELVVKLKVLAKSCELQCFLQMLYRKFPKWGMPFPSYDLTPSVGPAGYGFSDIIVESKTAKLIGWTCSMCSHSVPHMHAHKVILLSSSDYLRALFKSRIRESRSLNLQVPVGWKAMVILMHWLYSNKLPNLIPFGCLWDNMNTEKKLLELQPYLELCHLAERWLLEDIKEDCWNVIVACLDSAIELCNNILQISAKSPMGKLVEVVAEHMARSYPQLRDSGEFELLDVSLVNLIHSAFVRIGEECGLKRPLCDCGEFEELDEMPATYFFSPV